MPMLRIKEEEEEEEIKICRQSISFHQRGRKIQNDRSGI
jgi:hypothetical protein